MADSKNCVLDHYKGWLYKWTNYLKGYQKRWFVLQNGYLSYYRNQGEVSSSCRGTINLANAFIHTQDSCSFVISNSGTMTFHLKANSEVERQRWVTALELAKSKAITRIESDDEEEPVQPEKDELMNVLRTLNTKLDDLRTCNDLISKHGAALQRALVDIEQTDNAIDMLARIKPINERATLFRITSTAMLNTCGDFVKLAQEQGVRWQKLLQYEHDQRIQLEDMVEQLGKQHSILEKQIRKSLNNPASGQEGLEGDEDEDEFFDADDDNENVIASDPHRQRLPDDVKPSHLQEKNYESSDTDVDKSSNESSDQKKKVKKIRSPATNVSLVSPAGGNKSISGISAAGGDRNVAGDSNSRIRQRRTTIPERPNYSINLWSIMKNCIGKELSKIPMPVNFSEPLSFLQRLTEDFEYSDCLDAAAACTDPFQQAAYVAAFTISSYANTTVRTGKPFNPLLGETFECDRSSDLGWKAVCEQVSHHPPTAAMYAEGRNWNFWQEFTMASKFRGKYLQIVPLGIAHLTFPQSGNHFTWRKVTTTVNNIIVGRLWVDNHGEMDIMNHTTGDVCHLKYFAYSYFSREAPRKVTGVIKDASGIVRYVLTGTWDSKMEGAKVLNGEEVARSHVEYVTSDPCVLWQRRYPPPELEKCYNFTQLAVQLNELEDGVAPTDSRYRPDQRLMENGLWDEANNCKVLLEEKQRAARRVREKQMEEAAATGTEYHGYEPKWFCKQNDPQTGNLIHVYTGEYWQCKAKQDWSRCPDIFLDSPSTTTIPAVQ